MKYTIVDIARGFKNYPRIVYIRKMDAMERKISEKNKVIANDLKALITFEDLYDTHSITSEKEYFRHRKKQEAGKFAGLYAQYTENELKNEQKQMLKNMGYEIPYALDIGDIFDKPPQNCIMGESKEGYLMASDDEALDKFLQQQWWQKIMRD